MTVPPAWDTVLVGTDGSVTAGRAVRRAVAVAAASGARLLVAFVGDANTGEDVIAAVLAQYDRSGVELDGRVLSGDPADALLGLAVAEGAGLIVVGSKGMSGAQRFLLGSVPNRVSHKAACDVLIVHTLGAQS